MRRVDRSERNESSGATRHTGAETEYYFGTLPLLFPLHYRFLIGLRYLNCKIIDSKEMKAWKVSEIE
jgi:hypothetical protein